jgi:hypothetical protein
MSFSLLSSIDILKENIDTPNLRTMDKYNYGSVFPLYTPRPRNPGRMAEGGYVDKYGNNYGSAFLRWNADGSADREPVTYVPGPRPARMADGGNVNYTIQPGTPFYNYFNSLRGNKIGA